MFPLPPFLPPLRRLLYVAPFQNTSPESASLAVTLQPAPASSVALVYLRRLSYYGTNIAAKKRPLAPPNTDRVVSPEPEGPSFPGGYHDIVSLLIPSAPRCVFRLARSIAVFVPDVPKRSRVLCLSFWSFVSFAPSSLPLSPSRSSSRGPMALAVRSRTYTTSSSPLSDLDRPAADTARVTKCISSRTSAGMCVRRFACAWPLRGPLSQFVG